MSHRDDLDATLAEQRRELMAARTLDLDLDMAFNLQMHEAVTASLAQQPSTSRPPPPSPPPLQDEYDDVLDLAAALMLEDVERFAQEHDDHERSLLEARKAKEDLDRRIHDQNFAAEVKSVPEDYWKEYGDWFEKPYETTAASSSSKSIECLRLYCKGLVSEEVVRDSKVVVAGAGVAICDPRDNPILEKRKIVEAFDGGVVRTNEAVELEAVIEGLNSALALDLNHVTIFFDDYMLYQYVTNRVLPGNSRIATLVNQLALLQRKFEYCSPSLVERSNIKFAFQLAREAIISQITWHAETSNGKSLKETCVICFEETDVADMFSIDGCLHRYCFSCMKQHVEVKLLNGQVAQCPHESCKSEINVDSCAKFLAPKLVEVMSQRIKESSIPVTQKVYCPNARCSALMSKNEVLQYTNTFYVGGEQSGVRRCMKCLSYFCINCKVPWHYNMTCYDYKRAHPHPRAEDQLLKSLANKKHWRQCVKCKNMVELAEGCYHITCRCGYEFCYTCGAEWKNKKPTCSCPIWDERNIIREPPRQVQPIVHHQPRQGQPIGREQQRQVQPNMHQQPRQVQPNMHQQPRQVQPNMHQQPRQVQPNRHQQPRQGQPNMHHQPRQVQPNMYQQQRQVQPNLHQQPRQGQPQQAQPWRPEQPRQVRRRHNHDYY